MALKLTVTPSTQYIEDSINVKITGGTIPNNLVFFVEVWKYQGDIDGNYGRDAYVQDNNLSSNFNFVCPNSAEQTPSGYNYGLPDVYQVDFTKNTSKLNVAFTLYQNQQEIAKVRKTMYIKPDPPTFDVTPTYEDINSDSLTLTNDNQMIVTGLSKLQISNINVSPKKYGNITKIKVNGIEYSYPEVHENGILLDLQKEKLSGPWLYMDAIDSRGFSNRLPIANVSKFKIAYQVPKINEFLVERDGVSETTALKAKGYYSEGYQVGANNLNASYTYKENISEAISHDGITSLTITKSALREYEDFLEILNQFNNPTYQVDENNLQYYDKQTFENGIDILFSTAISYNNNYTQEYLQADYDNANERYYCKSGGYNGSWKAFWQHTLEILYNVIYENGGNYEFEIESYIQGDTQNGFSIDKTFETSLHISDKFELTTLSSEAFLPTAIPAIDVYKDKVAFHGLFDENVETDIQLNGGVSINGVPVFEEQILWQDFGPTRGIFLLGNQFANLSKKISETKRGIVMVWSVFNTSTNISEDWGWNVFYIPKSMVSLSTGSGFTHIMATGKFENIGTKYFYVQDNRILGNAGNADTGTKNGITFANNKFALRYIIEV